MGATSELPAIDVANVSRVRRRRQLAAIVTAVVGTGLMAYLAYVGADSSMAHGTIALPLVGLFYGSPVLLAIYLMLRRRELLARRAAGTSRLHAHDGALFLGDEPLCRREDVTTATLARTDEGVLVTIAVKRGAPIELFVASVEDGRALLVALGADVGHRAHTISVPSGMPFFPMRVSVGVEGIDIRIPL
ncbi:MAG: hypothetical protein ABI175_30440, partial [Polyangiales bacterium]